jgi:16S rRNA U516 pseudouridylate synthase RsuA-like enzyme
MLQDVCLDRAGNEPRNGLPPRQASPNIRGRYVARLGIDQKDRCFRFALAHRLAHPRYGVEKVYEVEVEGEPTEEQLRLLREGVELDDGRRTAPARAKRLGRNRLELVLHEGRKHQVKRMCAAVGLPVTRLHRPRYAALDLGHLAPGEWRELTRAEIARLHAETDTKR